ncbi:MAG: hypothetical protein EKK64_05345 [Neisseriaceae bacterium]|nr:MAG: hypothetical protein EKK64_05345 [Neisseriaceae bacterium]
MKETLWYIGEIAEYYQVSNTAVSKWNLPPPVGSTKQGKFWSPETIKKWYKQTESGEIQRTKSRKTKA